MMALEKCLDLVYGWVGGWVGVIYGTPERNE